MSGIPIARLWRASNLAAVVLCGWPLQAQDTADTDEPPVAGQAAGEGAAAALTTFVTQHQIGVQTLGDWTVIEVNPQAAGNVSIARTISR